MIIRDRQYTPIDHIVIGGVELAYFLLESEWNKGYASEATASVVNIVLPYLKLNCNVDIPWESIVATVRSDAIICIHRKYWGTLGLISTPLT